MPPAFAPGTLRWQIYAGRFHYTDDRTPRSSSAVGSRSLGSDLQVNGSVVKGFNVLYSPIAPRVLFGSVQLQDRNFGFPLIYAILVTLPLPLLVWRISKPGAKGKCMHCGYDLAGLPRGAPCPECGRARTN